MEQPSYHKSLSQCMIQSGQNNKMNATLRIEEIETWLLENSCLHPEYGNKVLERNALLVRV